MADGTPDGPVRAALRELERNGIDAELRDSASLAAAPDDGPASAPSVGELVVPPSSARAAASALADAGFAAVPRGGSRFVGFDPASGEWVELRLDRGSLGRRSARGFTVALLGPDGAGKSTVAARVAKGFYLPVRSIYMGLYQPGQAPRSRRLPGSGLAVLLGRQWRRWAAAMRHRARGRLVLFDRYSYDSRLPVGRPLPWSARARRYMLGRACPPPDLVVVLDAPAEVLHARKGEHDLELLERHRQGYLQLDEALGPRSVVVDAQAEPAVVANAVTAAIWQRYARPGR